MGKQSTMKKVERSEITDALYLEIFERESHHDHEIVIDERGVYRWKKDPAIDFLVSQLDFNKLIGNLHQSGYDQNSELYRKIYRCIGYSLRGYSEIFYCELNNEAADEYRIDEIKDK